MMESEIAELTERLRETDRLLSLETEKRKTQVAVYIGISRALSISFDQYLYGFFKALFFGKYRAEIVHGFQVIGIRLQCLAIPLDRRVAFFILAMDAAQVVQSGW